MPPDNRGRGRATSQGSFFLSPEQAVVEIGEQAVRELEQLRARIAPAETGEIEYRPAPSLVVRSELEILGLSMPRFALRAYLDNAHRNFVNARRVPQLEIQELEWGTRECRRNWIKIGNIEEVQPGPGETLVSLIKGSSCIADSLLQPPEAEAEDYRFLTTELGRACGEGCDVDGSPYVKHIRLGGGQCAQAVAFMANTLPRQNSVRSGSRVALNRV